MDHHYHVTALQFVIYFNREGDHDHNGLIYCLTENLPVLKYVRSIAGGENGFAHRAAAEARLQQLKVPPADWPAYLPETEAQAKQPHPLLRPLVLRANVGGQVTVELKNEIDGRWVGVHLVSDGYDVVENDGSHVGANPHSLVPPGGTRTYTWECRNEGVFPFHDGGNYSGGQDGTNAHGLFGALIVEGSTAIWRDPVTGVKSTETPLDGLYLDVIPSGSLPPTTPPSPPTINKYKFPAPRPYPDFTTVSFREFVIFFHDEPEFVPPHHERTPDPCHAAGGGGHGGHGAHGDLPPIMPVSYRAEPMVNREHTLWKWLAEGHRLDRPVLNEEQHHSSWLFGDPVTPILKAYMGDPVRIRFVHAGVKETHVFHLHLYEWHAVPQDRRSPRIDAISVSPQTGHTIEPVWGAGNRQQVAGDAIWHCHLYPHFHEGMWGMFRTFETLQTGQDGPFLAAGGDDVYDGRRVGRYPDGTRIERLLPLPDRTPPPLPTATHPGYPLYIPGTLRQKSPVPPFPGRNMPADLDYRPTPTTLERNAFNAAPVPGEMFTRNPFAAAQARQWSGEPYNPADPSTASNFGPNGGVRVVDHRVGVDMMDIQYNGHGWHDKHGHLFYLASECSHPQDRPGPTEPLFFRALHGQILNLTLENHLPLEIPGTEFDLPFPPCRARPWEGECGLHVHMVKFDPICADGASVGWNYMSGPVVGKKMVYRWWLDQEFGTIFFHDHLFANYRQKHGLFGALMVEPIGARFLDPYADREIVSGVQARILLPGSVGAHTPLLGIPDAHGFREFCVGIGDFIPMWTRDGEPLNPPAHPGGHGDQGVMGLNYRNDPIHERLRPYPGEPQRYADPSLWFTSGPPYNRDPYTTRFATFANDPVWIRLVQGSHEEQHSFQVHGMRWPRFRHNVASPLQNQQTIGIAEAFTLVNHEPYGRGDYLYKLSGADDLWLGCWGVIRAFGDKALPAETGGLLPLGSAPVQAPPPPGAVPVRRFRIRVLQKRLVYRDPDLVDPFGLVYQLQSIIGPDGVHVPVVPPDDPDNPEPLVLRCREGEMVRIELRNRLPLGLRPEPFAPEVPVEARNPFSHRPERPVSSRASMHADLVRYDVRVSDGATVGKNPGQTAPPDQSAVYEWHTGRPAGTNAGRPIGPVLLQDMADFRNHRHHGLIGALIVEPADATPFRVEPGEPTAAADAPLAWNGVRATVRQQGGAAFEEAVLLLQDGLRHFLRGDIHAPIPDEPPGLGEDQPDHEDQGQKGFNYRSEPVGPNVDPLYNPAGGVAPGDAGRDWLANPHPATPVFVVPQGSTVRLHLLGACDKPRNHSFTVHGVSWREWPHLPQPRVASESAISAGTTRTYQFTAEHAGDHAYRSGVLKWAVPQGLWGLLRVEPDA